MKYTNTHAHLYRNKKVRTFEELGAGDCFTLKDDSRFFIKLDLVLHKKSDREDYCYNSIRIETGKLTYIYDDTPCVVAKDVRIDAKF